MKAGKASKGEARAAEVGSIKAQTPQNSVLFLHHPSHQAAASSLSWSCATRFMYARVLANLIILYLEYTGIFLYLVAHFADSLGRSTQTLPCSVGVSSWPTSQQATRFGSLDPNLSPQCGGSGWPSRHQATRFGSLDPNLLFVVWGIWLAQPPASHEVWVARPKPSPQCGGVWLAHSPSSYLDNHGEP